MKKIIVFLTAFLTLTLLCGCSGSMQKTEKICKAEDYEFYLSLQINNKNFFKNEKAIATLTLVNKSSKDIEYELADYLSKYFFDNGVEPVAKDALRLETRADGVTYAYESIKAERRYGGYIKAGEMIESKVEFSFDTRGKKFLRFLLPICIKKSDGTFPCEFAAIYTEEVEVNVL